MTFSQWKRLKPGDKVQMNALAPIRYRRKIVTVDKTFVFGDMDLVQVKEINEGRNSFNKRRMDVLPHIEKIDKEYAELFV